MSEITISLQSFLKIHSHSFKYCTNAVNGILLGYVEKSVLNITDVIPLSHSMTLLPMFEVALIQIEAYCKINQIEMIGYYYANENTFEKDLEPIAKRVADKLYNELNSMCFLGVTEINEDNPLGLIPIGRNNENQWVKSSIKQLRLTGDKQSPSYPKSMIQAHVKDGKLTQFNDFEDYLNNPTLDWLNRPSSSSSQ
ncbi:UPF0172 protein [Heterostelium album PN500]|uniref:UPF0172 protein n=1 Tax=Heterostelium pallidum (strain ATCC 26659 / Pp 5 / PN500) TaxID=670386 RepID=D3BSK2_HETP5|nr:UPF0172 protein [Heterostelium album PN500]EFA75467.1 UPF0172 protein [Heterostelium album PN500]|eukprot:XP_020427601.1 UPF0172 protein [Heterostelium album PN500]